MQTTCASGVFLSHTRNPDPETERPQLSDPIQSKMATKSQPKSDPNSGFDSAEGVEMSESKVASGTGANGGAGAFGGDGDLVNDNKNMEGLTQAEAPRRLKVSQCKMDVDQSKVNAR